MHNWGHDHPRLLNIPSSFLSLAVGFGVQVTFQSGNNLPMAVLPTSSIIFCPKPQHGMLFTDKKAPALQQRSDSLSADSDTNVQQSRKRKYLWWRETHKYNFFFEEGGVYWDLTPPVSPHGLEGLKSSNTKAWQVCWWPPSAVDISSWRLHEKISPIFAAFCHWWV